MANQITGRIIEIGQTVQIPSKNGGSSFTKREFILDATTYDPYTGERSEYENVIPLEFSGDKCAELDRFNQGDVVTVSFVLQGRSWTNQDGEFKRMASIRCYKIDARGGVSQSQQTTSIQQPAPQPTYQQQPQNFPPPVDANGNVKDDLPFQRMLFDLKNEYQIPKFKEYVNKLFSERAVVEVKKKLPNRTLAQNSYLHLLLGYFGSEYGCSLDEAKIDFYKRTCNRDLFERKTVNKKGNEVTYLRSSAELTTGEMTLSIDRFRNWSASVAGIYLPAANEHQMLIYAQQEIQRNQEFIQL